MASLLDRVPRPLRLLPAGLSGLLILGAMGKLRVPEIGSELAMAVGTSAVAAASAYTVLRVLRSRPRGSTAARRGAWRACRAFAVRALGGGESASALLRALKERAAQGRVSYSLHSFIDDGGVVSILVISGGGDSVVVEGEILKAIASALGGIRLEEIEEPERLCIEPPPVGRQGLLDPGMISANGARRRYGSGFVLGERLDTPEPVPVKLYIEDAQGHIGVFGSTGSGKSTTAAVLSCGYSKLGLVPVIADWTGEYESLLSQVCPGVFRVVDPLRDGVAVDPLALARMTGDYDLAVEVLSQGLGLTDPQEFLLSSVIDARRPASLPELYEAITGVDEASKWDREVKRGLQRRIGLLLRGHIAALFRGTVDPPSLDKPTVLRLDSIRLTTARRLYTLLLLAWVYSTRGTRRAAGDVLFVIDEAHNTITGEQQLVETLLSESRKYGLYLVIVTQSPSLMPERVLLNTNTKIIHAIKGPRDKAVVVNALGLGQAKAALLDRLAPGEALLVSASNPEPILLRVKYGHLGGS